MPIWKVLFFGMILLTLFLVMPPVFADTWYVGKGLKQGDFFRYNVCYYDYHNCTPLEIDFWVKNQTVDGSGWNLKFLAIDGAMVQRGNVTIGTSISYTTHFDPNIANYADIYNNTIAWLDLLTTKDSPKHFSDSMWGRVDSGYCSPSIGPLGHETVTVQAGTFDTWKIGFHGAADSMIWIAPNLPFPIKGSFYVACLGTAGAVPWFNLELLQTGNSQTFPPQFLKSDLPTHRDSALLSPSMQLNCGTSTQNIVCSNGLELVYKSTNGYPACIRPQTAENLIKRGWENIRPVNYLIKVSGILVPYNITGGKIHDARLYTPSESLFFSFNMTSNGMLNVTLPRTLINGTCNERCFPTFVGKDVPFVIINQNGQQVYSMEIKTTPVNRTLSIHIQSSTKQIEIFTANPI